MIKFLKDLFSEQSHVSSMRVMAMMCCITAIVIGLYGMLKQSPDYSGLALLCTTFLGTAFGAKVIQKRSETDGARAEVEENPKD